MFSRTGSYNYINVPSDASLALGTSSSSAGTWVRLNSSGLFPERTNEITCGTSSLRWKAVYIGTANSYGSTSSPIYWNAGVPAAVNAKDTCNAFINALGLGDSTPVDADYYVSQYVNGGTTTTTYHRRPMSCLWNYVKGKADEVYVNVTGDTMTGNLTVSKSGPAIYAQDTANNNLYAGLIVGSGHQNHGVYSNGYAPTASTFTSSSKWIIYRGNDGEAHSQLKIYGAVWNDYAEYRKDNPTEKEE